MHEDIYNSEIDRFISFAQYEDSNHNLENYIKHIPWEGKSVLEAGIGTGRMTTYYIDKVKEILATDISQNMLKYCSRRLHEYSLKIKYICCPHDDLNKLNLPHYDIFFSAYSLCYLAVENMYTDIDSYLDMILPEKVNNYIIIENVGIFSHDDEYIRPFYNYYNALTRRFKYKEIRTDFLFPNIELAVRATDDFFGKDISEKVFDNHRLLVPEITGIWYDDIK